MRQGIVDPRPNLLSIIHSVGGCPTFTCTFTTLLLFTEDIEAEMLETEALLGEIDMLIRRKIPKVIIKFGVQLCEWSTKCG